MKNKGMKLIATVLVIISLILPAGAQNRETREVSKFNKISYRIPGKLVLRQGSPQKVQLEGEAEVLKEIETNVREGRLIIGDVDEDRWFSWRNSDNRNRVNVYITVENIEGLYVSGSGDALAEGIINSEELELKVSGSGSLEIQVEVRGNLTANVSGSGDLKVKGNCGDLQSNVSGSGKVFIANSIKGRAKFGVSGSGKVLAAGKAEEVKAVISGSGKVLAADLETDRCEVSISGSGDVEINVKSELDARITGSGSVMYKGNPNHVNASSSGSGKVRKIQS